MASKDVQDYLDKGLYGAPQIKPDEKKKYLGTFRERVVFILTAEEMKHTSYESFCQKEFDAFPDGHILINANINITTQNKFMQLAQKANRPFRLVDADEEQMTNDDIGLVYAVDTAINIDDIRAKLTKNATHLNTSQPDLSSKEEVKSTSFFKKIFSKE